MSKPAAPSPQREPVTLPPIFWSLEDDAPKTTTREIYLVYVSTIDKSGERIPLDCTPLDGLPEYPHQLGEKYGVPLVELVARDQNGLVVARVTHRTRVPAAAPAAAPAAVPASSTLSDTLAIVNAMNERADRFMMELVKSRDASSAEITKAVTAMAGQRIVDSQALFETLMKSKHLGNAAAAVGADKGELATFMKGIDWAQKMMAQGMEEGDDDGIEGLFKVAAEEFMRAKALAAGGGPRREPPPRPRPRVVPDPIEDPT